MAGLGYGGKTKRTRAPITENWESLLRQSKKKPAKAILGTVNSGYTWTIPQSRAASSKEDHHQSYYTSW
jgi:hypothetical protein